MQPQPSDSGTNTTPTASSSNASKPLIWVSAILAVIGMVVTAVLSLGIAVIFWGPAVILFAIAMWGVWGARRQRQLYEHRGPDEMKNPEQTGRSWPTEGVIDDRLPQN